MLSTLACAVCGAGPDPSQDTWVVMSLIISFLPLALLGGIVALVVHRARTMAREDEATQQR